MTTAIVVLFKLRDCYCCCVVAVDVYVAVACNFFTLIISALPCNIRAHTIMCFYELLCAFVIMIISLDENHSIFVVVYVVLLMYATLPTYIHS